MYHIFFFLIYIFEGQLLYDVVLVYAVRQCESDINIDTHTHTMCVESPSHSHYPAPFDPRRPLSWAPVWYRSSPLAIHCLHGGAHMSVFLSQCALLCPQVCSLPQHLCSCSANGIICNIFPASIYLCVNPQYLLFYLTYFSLYDNSGPIHIPTGDPVLFHFTAEQYSIVCICKTSFFLIGG